MKNLTATLVVALACTALQAQKPRTGAHSTPFGRSGQAIAPQTSAERAVVLRGGKLLTITHGVIDDGVLVMSGGRITAVGRASEVRIPRGAEIIDVRGMTVYPGLIDSETNLGLTEISAEKMTNDLVETSDEIMPHMHVADAFHAESSLIPVTRINGITNAVVAPADQDTLSGQDSFIQLYGKDADEMLLVRDNALALNFTGTQRRNDSFEKAKFPFTRMGMAAQLRQAFIDAQQYAQKWEDFRKSEKKDKEQPKRDLKLEALLPYLEGKRPVVLAAEEPNDVETAMRLAREFKFKVVLSHISHSTEILDEIASWKLPVIVGPIYSEPKDDERYDRVYRLPAELVKRGVKIAFASYDAHNVRNLPYAAGYAISYGLSADEALKALTLNAAEIWGMADQYGSLDAGKVANVVVADGDPLDVKTDVKRVFIAGHAVQMTSKQTVLRDEYGK